MDRDFKEKEITVKELMLEFDLSRCTMWKYRKLGMPFKRKMNGQVRFNTEECREWIKENILR